MPHLSFKSPQTIWKYNALFHLTSEHATDSTPPKIPRQLLADMHITREEEKALKITKEATDAGGEHDIPCTESLLEMIQAEEIQKERDQTQFPQLFLTDMTQKDLEYILYQSKQFLELVHRRKCEILCYFPISTKLWQQVSARAQPHFTHLCGAAAASFG